MQWFRKRTEMGMIGHGCSTCLNDSNWRPYGDPTWPSKGLDLHLRDAGWCQQSVRRLQLLRPRCRSSMCGLGNYQRWHLKACLLNMNLKPPSSPKSRPKWLQGNAGHCNSKLIQLIWWPSVEITAFMKNASFYTKFQSLFLPMCTKASMDQTTAACIGIDRQRPSAHMEQFWRNHDLL